MNESKLIALAGKCLQADNVKPIAPYKSVEIYRAVLVDNSLVILLQDGRKFKYSDYVNMAAKQDQIAMLKPNMTMPETQAGTDAPKETPARRKRSTSKAKE